MKYFLFYLCLIFSALAVDPTTNQPTIGGKNLIVATNGYAHTLHVRDFLEVTAGGAHIFNQITNDALQTHDLVVTGPNKELGSVVPGNAGDVLTSGGAGVTPSFQAPTGVNNWKDSGTTNSTLSGVAYPWAVVATNSVTVGAANEQGVVSLYSTNGTHVVTIKTASNGTLDIQIDGTNQVSVAGNGAVSLSGTTNQLSDDGSQLLYNGSPLGGGDTIWTNDSGVIYTTTAGSNFRITSSGDGTMFMYGLTSLIQVRDTQSPGRMRGSLSPGAFELKSTNQYIILDSGVGDYFPITDPIIGIVSGGGGNYDNINDYSIALMPYLVKLGTNTVTATNDTLYLNGMPVGSSQLWTNDAGNVHVIGDTNLFFNTQVADAADAVAFYFNSSNTLTTAGSKIASFGNGGTNVNFIHRGGGIDIGRNIIPYWGPDETDMFAAVFDSSIGEPTTGNFLLSTVDDVSDTTASGELKVKLDQAGQNFLSITALDAGGNFDTIRLRANGGSTNGGITFARNGVNSLVIEPNTEDGATPFKLGTSVAHTSGNLLEVANNGTNVFGVRFDGAALIGKEGFPIFTDASTNLIFSVDGETSSFLIINPFSGTSGLSGQSGFSFGLNNTSNGEYLQMFPGTHAYEVGSSGSTVFNFFNAQTNVDWMFQNPLGVPLRVYANGDFTSGIDTNSVATFTGVVHAKDFIMDSSALKTDETDAHVGRIQVHDTDDNIYRDLISFTNGNTPVAQIGGASGMTLTVQPNVLKSSDGSTGITTNIVVGLATFTIKNGIIVGISL